MKQYCDKCRYWRFLRETEPHVSIGQCHRYAPRAAVKEPQNQGVYPHWPATMFDDWCGEFEPKA
jgi:hypothetical protein